MKWFLLDDTGFHLVFTRFTSFFLLHYRVLFGSSVATTRRAHTHTDTQTHRHTHRHTDTHTHREERDAGTPRTFALPHWQVSVVAAGRWPPPAVFKVSRSAGRRPRAETAVPHIAGRRRPRPHAQRRRQVLRQLGAMKGYHTSRDHCNGVSFSFGSK